MAISSKRGRSCADHEQRQKSQAPGAPNRNQFVLPDSISENGRPRWKRGKRVVESRGPALGLCVESAHDIRGAVAKDFALGFIFALDVLDFLLRRVSPPGGRACDFYLQIIYLIPTFGSCIAAACRLPSSRRSSICSPTWCRTAIASSARTISSPRCGAAGSYRI